MLTSLSIRNLALIEQADIEFSEGLCILTGETGSGKSILLDGIGLALGERGDRDLIMHGCEKAFVEAMFMTANSALNAKLSEAGIPSEEDGSLLVTRELHISGKNVCRINGRTVTLSMLRDIMTTLVDIHGQHKHQALLQVENHLPLIDSFGGSAIEVKKQATAEVYAEWKALRRDLNRLLKNERDGIEKKPFYESELNDLTELDVKPGEMEKLEAELNLMRSGEQMWNLLTESCACFGDGERDGALNLTRRAADRISALAELNPEYTEPRDMCQEALVLLEEAASTVRSGRDDFSYDEKLQSKKEERLYNLQTGLVRYGGSEAKAVARMKELAALLDSIENSGEVVAKLKAKEAEILRRLIERAKELSEERKAVAADLAAQLKRELGELGMPRADFKVWFNSESTGGGKLKLSKEELRPDGFDKAEFLIAPNPGQELHSLAKTASGGEISRVMLAFKTVTGERDGIDTMIFDEIDTGISGRMAQVVAEKLIKTSLTKQIICVTHLPQIAAAGCRHFNVAKFIEDTDGGVRTRTRITMLSDSERCSEIARMIGGADSGDTSLVHAEAMLRSAEMLREELGNNANSGS